MAAGPNVLFFHVDNLGFGELSCYSAGPFRGVWTTRVDGFAAEGFRSARAAAWAGLAAVAMLSPSTVNSLAPAGGPVP